MAEMDYEELAARCEIVAATVEGGTVHITYVVPDDLRKRYGIGEIENALHNCLRAGARIAKGNDQ